MFFCFGSDSSWTVLKLALNTIELQLMLWHQLQDAAKQVFKVKQNLLYTCLLWGRQTTKREKVTQKYSHSLPLPRLSPPRICQNPTSYLPFTCIIPAALKNPEYSIHQEQLWTASQERRGGNMSSLYQDPVHIPLKKQ